MDTEPRAIPALNADPAELARFNQLAARWWDESSEFKPLHRINPHRLDWIDQLCTLQGKAALDVGCGGGILAEAMARRGAHVTGIDLADKPLRIAQAHAHGQPLDLRYVKSNAENWAAGHAAQYDVVTCMEMLEHVPDPRAVIAACAQMVKPGGWVFFSTINRNPLSYLLAIVGVEYVLRILPRGTHQFERFIKPRELLAMAGDAGLTLAEQRGLGYNPLTQRFHLHRFTGVGYLLAMQKPARGGHARPGA
jgi:2-polyprenyl-6-hydroxyphenyl methylase / 3-demethylubiquinone-9 3-methyltransferase